MTMLPLYSAACQRVGEPSVAKLTARAERALRSLLAETTASHDDLPMALLLSTAEQDEVHILPTPSNDRENRRLACAVIPRLIEASDAQVAAFVFHGWGLTESVPLTRPFPRPSQHPQLEERVMLTVLDREGSEQFRCWHLRRNGDAAPTLHALDSDQDGEAAGLFVDAMRCGLSQWCLPDRLVGGYTPTAARPRVLGYAFADERQAGEAEQRLLNAVPACRWHRTVHADGADGRPELYWPAVSTEQEEEARGALGATGEELPVSGDLAAQTLMWGALTVPLLEAGDLDAARWMAGKLDELPPLPAEPAPASRAQRVGRNDPCPCGAAHADGRPMKSKRCCNV